MNTMNKRVRSSVSAKTKDLEEELAGKNIKQQSTFSVEAGRDVQTDLSPWQKSALGNQEQFAIRQGFRRRHPTRLLNQFAGAVKTNVSPKMKWEQFMEAENERVQLPETTKKARNVYVANQLGLVETALKNFVQSKEKLNSIVAVGV